MAEGRDESGDRCIQTILTIYNDSVKISKKKRAADFRTTAVKSSTKLQLSPT
jgi:hypothetical protein